MAGWLLLLLLCLSGFAFIRAVWPAPRQWSAADPLRLAAAPAIGLGIASSLYFALRVVLQLQPFLVLGATTLAGLAFVGVAWWRAPSAPEDPTGPRETVPAWLWLVTGVSTLMALLTYLMLSGAAPHGEWDAWSIWNLRARFLFRAQEFASPFSNLIDWAHPDYPLLVPGAIAVLWHAAGSESPALAAAVGLLFLASSVGVPFYLVQLLRGPSLAAICVPAILGATAMIRVSASQYADVPLSAYFVVAGCFLVYGLETRAAGTGPILVAGLAAGFAAWTKNEGLLFCASLIAAHLIALTSREELASRFRLTPPLLCGVVAVLALVGHFKYRIAPPNDLVNASNSAVFGARMHDFNRYWVTFWAFVGEFLTFGNVLVPPVIVFAVWLALVRFRSKVTGALLIPIVAAAIQLAGYFAVYVLASKDLDWQLNTSLSRLLLHVWPLAITGIFLISGDIFCSTPQPAPQSPRSK